METQKQTIVIGEEPKKTDVQMLISDVRHIFQKNQKPKRSFVDKMGLYSMYVLIFWLAIIFIPAFYQDAFGAAPAYIPVSPSAQQAYNAWASQRCSQEKALAVANLADIGHGIKMDNKDLNDLYVKAQTDCSSTQQTF